MSQEPPAILPPEHPDAAGFRWLTTDYRGGYWQRMPETDVYEAVYVSYDALDADGAPTAGRLRIAGSLLHGDPAELHGALAREYRALFKELTRHLAEIQDAPDRQDAGAVTDI